MCDVDSDVDMGYAQNGLGIGEGCGMPIVAPGVGAADPMNIAPGAGDPKPIPEVGDPYLVPYVGDCACGGIRGDEVSPGFPGGLNCS